EQRLLGIVSAHDAGRLNGFQVGGGHRCVIEETASRAGLNAEARLAVQLNGAADGGGSRNYCCSARRTVRTLGSYCEGRQTGTGCVGDCKVLTSGGSDGLALNVNADVQRSGVVAQLLEQLILGVDAGELGRHITDLQVEADSI